MLIAQRNRLITRAVATLQGFDAVTITFPGKSPIAAAKRVSPAAAFAGLGGLSGTAPAVFLITASDLPAGVTLTAKVTTFVCQGVTYLLDDFSAMPSEPQIRMHANVASR